MAEAPFDLGKAHRWFAIECNNLAWDLLEKADRSEEETQAMLHVAHSALWHWQHAGGGLNRLRALCLLATAYAAAGLVDGALRYAEPCVAGVLNSPDEADEADTPSAFDIATAHGCMATACRIAGRDDDARSHYDKAIMVAEGFEHADDRKVFDQFYPAPD